MVGMGRDWLDFVVCKGDDNEEENNEQQHFLPVRNQAKYFLSNSLPTSRVTSLNDQTITVNPPNSPLILRERDTTIPTLDLSKGAFLCKRK